MNAADVMPVGDLDNWRQIFTDNFDTDVALGDFPEHADGWSAYPYPWTDTTDNGTYHPHRVVSIVGGILNKHLHTENGEHLISAIMPEVPGTSKNGQLYGRYAVRWRLDNTAGYKIAWMLWPDSNQWADGEIDGPEMNTDSVHMGAYMHRIDLGAVDWVHRDIDPDLWHTTILEWSPGLVVVLHDSTEILRTDTGVPDTPMHWILQTEVNLSGDAPPVTADGNVQIAWVAAWQWDPTAKAPPKPRQMTVTAPASATGAVTFAVDASPDVDQVKAMVAGRQVWWSNKRPFTMRWDSTAVANGVQELSFKGHGAWWFPGPTRTITVRNPLVLVAPNVCTGIVTLGITPYLWLVEVKWVVDGREVGSRQSAPFTCKWNSLTAGNGTHTIYVKAKSAMYGWADGPEQTITVTN